jgi:hypothetical protein
VPVRAFFLDQIHTANGHVIVVVSTIGRRGRFQQPLKIGQQQGFMLIDDDGQCRMKRLNVHHAESEARVGNKPLDPIGQVDELSRPCGRDVDAGVAASPRRCERLHRCPPRRIIGRRATRVFSDG